MNSNQLETICKSLLQYDPDIVEVIQFGSSVYAPQYAGDVDLLVITKDVKDYGGYLDAANPANACFNTDVAVFKVGQMPGKDFIRNVLGAFKILYGDGQQLLKYAEILGDPTFDEAKSSLRVASSLMKLSLETENQLDRDRLAREAFDALFHAARIASMVYLSAEVTRWGLIRRSLPEPYKSRFEAFINILHVKYFYNGEYPEKKARKEFDRWFKKVEKYVHGLESKVKVRVRGRKR